VFAAPQQPQRAALASGEPIIHVSIGRVELRAAQPPAAPQRVSSPQPQLSLTSYLEQRHGGRR